MFENYPDVVTIKELTDMLRIGKSQAYRLVKDRSVNSRYIGNKLIITKKSVIDYMLAEEHTSVVYSEHSNVTSEIIGGNKDDC